jgi:hypothetical protein
MYYLPSLLGRLKQDASRILTLNFLLGWTFIGWIVILVWALKKDNPASNSYSELKEMEVQSLN